MANAQIKQFQQKFENMNIHQKKEFIQKLQDKLKGSSNPEWEKFLNDCVNSLESPIQSEDIDFSDLIFDEKIMSEGKSKSLVECGDCGKSVSVRAKACPNCGNPIVSSGNSVVHSANVSSDSVAFENRIEEYKAFGYQLVKRSGNTVEMQGFELGFYGITANAKSAHYLFCILGLSIIMTIASILLIIFWIFLFGVLLLGLSIVAAILSWNGYKNTGKTYISINSFGKIWLSA